MPKVRIEQIHIGRNRRPIRDKKVEELKESIRANGLLNPITVDQNMNLVAGLHRLTACVLLGLTEIECHVVTYKDSEQARLAEIDENLIRNELRPLERGQLWYERIQILKKLGLRAKRGDNQHTLKASEPALREGFPLQATGEPRRGEIISPPLTTNHELAKKAGYSERTLQQGLQIAKDIHPEVQQMIEGTAIADSTTELLKVARAGASERILVEQAQQALRLAQTIGKQTEAQLQAQLLAEAEARQKELQMLALKSALAERDARLALKKVQRQLTQSKVEKVAIAAKSISVKVSDEWILGRHLVYCGDTSSQDFMNLLPGNAALAIATLSSSWEHDYLLDEAKIVAVLRSEGQVYEFCSRHRLPFQYELLLGNLYVGIFSHQSIFKPQIPINIQGIEGIVNYLLNLYTSQNNFVIAPFMGQGEVLIACERLGRICFIGDKNPNLVAHGIMRWQDLTKNRSHK
jgi:ParB family transcriptional regulator, chromosome partitioning protein